MKQTRTGRVWLTLWSVCTLSAVAACSLLVQSNRNQCESDAECTDRFGAGLTCKDEVCQTAPPTTPPVLDAGGDADAGPPADPAWSCVGGPPLQPPANETLHIVGHFQSLDGGGALGGLTLKACSSNDPQCNTPFPGSFQTGADGGFDIPVAVPVQGGFRGFVDTGATAEHPNLLTALFPVQPGSDFMVGADVDAGAYVPKFPITLLDTSDLEGYAASDTVKVPLNPEKGHILFVALDCQWNPIPNATVSTASRDSDTRRFYLDDKGEPSSLSTAAATRGGFLNLPTGSKVPIDLIRKDGVKVGSQNVTVRKGAITYLFLSARP